MASFVRSAPPRRAEWSLEDAAQFAALKEFKLLQLLSTDKKALATARRLGFLFGHTQTQPHSPAAPVGGAAAPAPRGAADASSSSPSAAPSRARQRPARGAQPAVRAPAQMQTHPPAVTVGGAAATATVAPLAAGDLLAAGSSRANAKQHRSAERSARRHLARQRRVRASANAMLYLVRLRRRALQRRVAADSASDQMSEFSTRVTVDCDEMHLEYPTSPCSSASSKRGRSESPPPSSAGSSGSAARTPLLLAHVQHVGRSRRTVWTGCVSIAGDVSARAGGNTKG